MENTFQNAVAIQLGQHLDIVLKMGNAIAKIIMKVPNAINVKKGT